MNLFATVLPWAAGAFVVALVLAGWRLLRGPTLADRILALDTLYVNSVALLVLIGIHFDTAVYFEVALIIARNMGRQLREVKVLQWARLH